MLVIRQNVASALYKPFLYLVFNELGQLTLPERFDGARGCWRVRLAISIVPLRNSSNTLVELNGIEPMTSGLQSPRSPN